jgi:hypothetical protein
VIPICVNRADQLPQDHASLAGDFLQAVPERIFNADAGLVSCNDNRALRNRRLHRFSPQMSHLVLYDRITLRARKPRLGATPAERTASHKAK